MLTLAAYVRVDSMRLD